MEHDKFVCLVIAIVASVPIFGIVGLTIDSYFENQALVHSKDPAALKCAMQGATRGNNDYCVELAKTTGDRK